MSKGLGLGASLKAHAFDGGAAMAWPPPGRWDPSQAPPEAQAGREQDLNARRARKVELKRCSKRYSVNAVQCVATSMDAEKC